MILSTLSKTRSCSLFVLRWENPKRNFLFPIAIIERLGWRSALNILLLLFSCRRSEHLGSQDVVGGSSTGSSAQQVIMAARSVARTTIVLKSTYWLGNGVVSISYNNKIVIGFSDRDFSPLIGFPHKRLCMHSCGVWLVALVAN